MSKSSRPPPTTLHVQPGQDPYEALARELAERPDGVVALKLMSQMNKTLRPRQEAIDQLVEALVLEIGDSSSERARAAVAAATAHWESVCQGKLTQELMDGFRQDAANLVERRRTSPPDIREILHGVGDRRDFAYEAGDLGGLQGTWHRLWGLLVLDRSLHVADEESMVATLRAEFEGQLRRPMDASEWDRLVAHAHNHADTVMKPRFEKLADPDSAGAD